MKQIKQLINNKISAKKITAIFVSFSKYEHLLVEESGFRIKEGLTPAG